MSWFNPLGWWPPSPDSAPEPVPASGFQSIAVGVVARDYDASKPMYDALFGAVGLSGSQKDGATNYAGVLVLSAAQDIEPTQSAGIIIFVGSADTVDSAYDAALEAGAEAYDGGEGQPPSEYHWQSVRDPDGNVVYIVAQQTSQS